MFSYSFVRRQIGQFHSRGTLRYMLGLILAGTEVIAEN